MGVFAGPVLVLLAIVAIALSTRLRRATVADVAWLAGTPVVEPREAEVYARYLDRHRRYRLVGGLLGAAFAIVIGMRWSGTVTFGVGQGSPLTDVLFCSVAGIVIGALAAESYRIRAPRAAPASASLEPHPGPARRDLIAWARAFALAALVAGAAGAVLSGQWAVLLVAACGAVVVALAELTQRSIEGRRRPVSSEVARRVDARLRAFASTTVAWLELAAAVLGLSWVLATLPDATSGLVAVLQALVTVTGLVATLVLMHRAAPRPPRRSAPVLA